MQPPAGNAMTTLRQLARDVWVLTKGYWGSEERWSARLLLTAIIGLNLGLVGVNVLQNEANGALFTALQQQDAADFYRAFVIVVSLILLYLAVAVLRVYLDQTLQLRWRRWLTDQYLTRWLADRTFYRMRFSGRVDNPDQRISEDVRLFIDRSMFLGLGFLNALATLASFAALLWYLSGSITLSVGGFALTIPGYMFWVAVVYSGLGSAIAHLIGRPLIRLVQYAVPRYGGTLAGGCVTRKFGVAAASPHRFRGAATAGGEPGCVSG